MHALILILALAQAEYDNKYGSPEDLYNFYKNADSDDMPTTMEVTTEEDGYTLTMNRLARVSADSLRKLDKQELEEFKEALTMLMQSTEGEETVPPRTEHDVATRTANTHILTPEPTAINNILLDILDKLETRTEEATGNPTHSAAAKDINIAPTRHVFTDTTRGWITIDVKLRSDETTEQYEYDTTDTTRGWIPIDVKLKSNETNEQNDITDTVRQWIPIDIKLRSNETTKEYETTDLTPPIDATDETDTVLAQTTGAFEKTEPATSEDFNETSYETNTVSTDNDTALYHTTEFTTDKEETGNVTLPGMDDDYLTGSDGTYSAFIDSTIAEEFYNDSFSEQAPKKDDANSSATSSVRLRAEGFATTVGKGSFRRQMMRDEMANTTTKFRVRKTKTKTRRRKFPKFTYSTTTTKSRRRKTKRRTTTTTTTTPFPLDVPRLIELITNLTMDYGPNITSIVNKTLQDLPILTCPTVTTTEEPTTTEITTTPDPYGNLTGTIMGKCFVCGLETPAMPRNARCADAFAGDFIPLVPVDATARKMLASYRKYCRWMNVPKYIINETDPRSMWGRWTGGCSVRWIDISGIYTQRTCRNRHRAVMGKHWVSKRMAKLEMALQRMDTGCIISPMASLVPLSRGISLYARFHACVCTGSWCNKAAPSAQCMLHTVALSLMLLFIFRYIENTVYLVNFIT